MLSANSVMLINFCVDDGKRVGLEVPKVEVRFEKLNIEADVVIGSRALPTLINYSRDVIEVSMVFVSFIYTVNYYVDFTISLHWYVIL